MAISAGMAGCGSGSAATPGPTPTPTPTPAPTPNPAPAVTAISPNSAPAGALAFTLTVHGSNFVPASTVEWNGASRTTTFVSGSVLRAHIAAADLAASGTVAITVFNPAPGGGTSNASTFAVAVNTIAFVSLRALDGSDAGLLNLNRNIWVMNPDGSSQKPLTKLITKTSNGFVLESFNPVWSPDGSKIAYVSNSPPDGLILATTTFTPNIWVMNADGTSPTPLTRLSACFTCTSNGLNPVWSPDGSKIAFVSERALDGSDALNTPNSTQNVWVMNADGSSPVPLTRLTGELTDCLNPAWSPDGSKIVFHTRRALNGSDFIGNQATDNIWLMNADGSSQAALTKLTARIDHSLNPNPLWSPDGSKIVFVWSGHLDGTDFANDNSTANIWVMNADGSGQTPLTKLTAEGANNEAPTRP